LDGAILILVRLQLTLLVVDIMLNVLLNCLEVSDLALVSDLAGVQPLDLVIKRIPLFLRLSATAANLFLACTLQAQPCLIIVRLSLPPPDRST